MGIFDTQEQDIFSRILGGSEMMSDELYTTNEDLRPDSYFLTSESRMRQ
jgi:hypothetical protein